MENPNSTTDLNTKTITIEHIFPAEPAKVWQAWTSADQLEKWWGPTDWPASNSSFDFKPSGHWHYCMTGPDGTKACGFMDYTHIDEGRWFEPGFTNALYNLEELLAVTA